ncbi:hypothetical protein EON66_11990 [archaeon]|nr:MAG: hypothetical protein EON66_11990 [archaeon]
MWLQRETITILLNTVARVHRELGISFEFINIGGGLGIPYLPDQVRCRNAAALHHALAMLTYAYLCSQHDVGACRVTGRDGPARVGGCAVTH